MGKQSTYLVECYLNGFVVRNGVVFSPSGKRKKTHMVRGYSCFYFKDYYVFVHRLVALGKYGRLLFYPRMRVFHLNGVKTDNRDSNIGIGFGKYNIVADPKKLARKLGVKLTNVKLEEFY